MGKYALLHGEIAARRLLYLCPMITCENIFLSHVSALACWAIVGHKGLLWQTNTDVCDVRTSVKNNKAVERFGMLDSQFMSRIPRPLDILVPSHGRTFKSRLFTCHLCTNELPLGGLRRLTDHVFVTSPELTFVQMGDLLTDVQLSLVGMMLCGRYAIVPNDNRCTIEREPLTNLENLRRMVEASSKVRGVATARRALGMCAEGSRSPRESLAPLLLSLPSHMGGYELERPEFNRKIDLSPQAAAIAGIDCLTPDLCWYDHKTLMEYDSWENHQKGSKLASDDLRIQAYVKDDWTAITMRTANMNSSSKFDRIVRGVLAPAIHADVPRESTQFARLRNHLRDETMGFDPYVSSSEARTRLRELKAARERVGFGDMGIYV